jgi:Protein of unknown function (DUF3016)
MIFPMQRYHSVAITAAIALCSVLPLFRISCPSPHQRNTLSDGMKGKKTNMKIASILLLAATPWFGLGPAPVLGAQPEDVTIQYVHPEKFTDFRIYGRDTGWSASYFTGEISRDLRPALKRRFPGCKLTLRFTDIDLAGSNRTSPRGGRNVRVNRGEITPARMSFDFLLQDSAGKTLARGSTRVTDTSYYGLRSHPSSSEPLYYEKRMLKRWLNSIRVP